MTFTLQPPGLDHFFDDPAIQEPATPWFLGAAPAPRDEPLDDAGRAAMAEELQHVPLLGAADGLLDLVGEGRRLTARGELFAADRRQLERSRSGETSDGSVRSMSQAASRGRTLRSRSGSMPRVACSSPCSAPSWARALRVAGTRRRGPTTSSRRC